MKIMKPVKPTYRSHIDNTYLTDSVITALESRYSLPSYSADQLDRLELLFVWLGVAEV